MPELPSHIEFEYLGVYLENGFMIWRVTPYKCSGYEEETQEFVWSPVDTDGQNLDFETEEAALVFINQYGVLSEAFKNKLN